MGIIEATNTGDLDLLKEAIKKGADVSEIDRRYKRSGLHLATINNYYKIAKEIILAGADVNAKDRFGQTPLRFAGTNKNFKLTQLLFENGANPFLKDNQGQNTLEIEFVEKSYTHYKTWEKIQEFKTSNESKLGLLELGVINAVLENTFDKTQQYQQNKSDYETPDTEDLTIGSDVSEDELLGENIDLSDDLTIGSDVSEDELLRKDIESHEDQSLGEMPEHYLGNLLNEIEQHLESDQNAFTKAQSPNGAGKNYKPNSAKIDNKESNERPNIKKGLSL